MYVTGKPINRADLWLSCTLCAKQSPKLPQQTVWGIQTQYNVEPFWIWLLLLLLLLVDWLVVAVCLFVCLFIPLFLFVSCCCCWEKISEIKMMLHQLPSTISSNNDDSHQTVFVFSNLFVLVNEMKKNEVNANEVNENEVNENEVNENEVNENEVNEHEINENEWTLMFQSLLPVLEWVKQVPKHLLTGCLDLREVNKIKWMKWMKWRTMRCEAKNMKNCRFQTGLPANPSLRLLLRWRSNRLRSNQTSNWDNDHQTITIHKDTKYPK